jgi:hypothetical protein
MFSMYHQVLSDPIAEEPQITPMPSSYTVSGTPLNEIKEEYANGLGEVEVTDLEVLGWAFYYFSYDAQNITWAPQQVQYIKTVKPASAEVASESGSGFRWSNISILMNDTVEWKFNSTPKDYVIGYRPHLWPVSPKNIYLNGTRLDPSEYFYFYDGDDGFFYNFYENYDEIIIQNGQSRGTLMMTYEYEAFLPVSDWQVHCAGPDKYLSNSTQTITHRFNYNLTLGKSNIHTNLTARFKITMPDAGKIKNLVVDNIDGKTEAIMFTERDYSGNKIYEREDKILYLIANISVTSFEVHTISAHFDADFIVSFIDTVEFNWCEDRLVNGTTTRERDYKITILDGPSELALTNIWLNETQIWFPEVLRTDNVESRLGRGINIVNMNKSVFSPNTLPLDNLPEEERPVYVDGISIIGVKSTNRFYLYKGEVDIITVRYRAIRTLSLVILDSIRTPLPGYQARIYMKNTTYGSRVSLNSPIPYPIREANNNGQIDIRNVPNANFTIEIFDRRGNFVQNLTANSTTPINFLVTNVVHFPTTILVISGVSIAFILIGIIIFRRNTPSMK